MLALCSCHPEEKETKKEEAAGGCREGAQLPDHSQAAHQLHRPPGHAGPRSPNQENNDVEGVGRCG